MGLGLSDGDRVCIVGGGPAGAMSAMHLLNLAREAGLDLKILIFEPRDFSQPGPGGCNRCAGILSTRLLRGLEGLGIVLPAEVVQAPIRSYAAHLQGDLIPIHQPEPRRQIVSVYRGGGPRIHQGSPSASFDGLLLEHAEARGAQRIPARVRAVTWNDRPFVHFGSQRLAADLLVLATGVNSRSPLDPSFRYRSPPTAIMAQDEILRPEHWPADRVIAFFEKPRGMTFGALIPKGRYLNISLLGAGLPTDAVTDFLDAQGLGDELPAGSLCGCTPRIAIGPSQRYFGDRWVAVGDAAVTRLYKDGIGSAYLTAGVAMQTAIYRGISRWSFMRSYAPTCRKVSRDNLYGRLLFRLWSFTLRSPGLLGAWKRALIAETDAGDQERLHTRVLWGMFTGDEPYRDLFRIAVRLESLKVLLAAFGNEAR